MSLRSGSGPGPGLVRSGGPVPVGLVPVGPVLVGPVPVGPVPVGRVPAGSGSGSGWAALGRHLAPMHP